MVEMEVQSLINTSAMEKGMKKGESSTLNFIGDELQRERAKNAELMKRISSLEAQIQEKYKESLVTNEQVSCPDMAEPSFKRQKTEVASRGIENEMDENQQVKCMSTDMDDIAGDHEDESNISYKDRESCSGGPSELTFANTGPLMKQNREKDDKKEPCQLWNKKPRKVPFCPKEINKILESHALLSKNAQSHTIRKIIVFASLGIRHGCEDMYELDFNHFSVLRKGDPYVSSNNPGEHVLYENPGIQRKVFYPNRRNPTLCPVQILEEEKAMRPSDPSCPSCLFLCIKYGGRTRNLAQNEYVRQQMGRNKLKSFGPIMCRMAMLIHIRSGSFFFKALGITLLFMAGFPDDLVQRETKYRNLDLLQKYYRTDKDAEVEELFLSHSAVFDNTTSTKTKGTSRTNRSRKSHNLTKAPHQQPAPSTTTTTTQFGVMGYTSIPIQTHAMATASSQALADTSNATATSLRNNISYQYHNHAPYDMFPPQPANSFLPMLFWPPPPCYGSFPNYLSMLPRPYYNHPSSTCFTPKIIQGNDSDSNSSSSTSMEKPNCR